MSIKEAKTLKKGDRVVRTYDPAVYRVTSVGYWFDEWTVSMRTGKEKCIRLRGLGPLSSLSRVKP